MIEKNYVTFDINEVEFKRLNSVFKGVEYFPKDLINKLRVEYKRLNYDRVKKIGNTKENPIDYNFVLLRGRKGEVAYARNDSDKKYPNKITLITEFPLSLKSGKRDDPRKDWVSEAFKFFSPYFISDSEKIAPGQDFIRIKNRPYLRIKYCDPKNQEYYIRSRKYSDSALYGSKSPDYRDYRSICKWIVKEYRKLKRKKMSYENCFSKIQNKLTTLKFGNRKHPHISIDGIKTIYYKYRYKF